MDKNSLDDRIERQLELFPDKTESKKKIRIPKRSVYPTSFKERRSWIVDFHRYNNMHLPKSFWKRNGKQIHLMYEGMRRYYGISDDNIVEPRKGIF